MTLQTLPAIFSIARAIQIIERDGYTWNLTYSSDGSISSITDTFGRSAAFSWSYYDAPNTTGSISVPDAISQITLPDGTRLIYTYDPLPLNVGPSTTSIQNLAKIERVDGAGAVLYAQTYLYEYTDFPGYLTGIVDHRNVRIATYGYDAAGRAILTEGANGADRHTIEYGVSGNIRTRRVLNALGKATVYRFQVYNANYSSDVRLVGVDGEASPNCVAGSRSYTYNTNKFIAFETDEEGRVTSYTRDLRGRPSSIIRGAGTPAAITTTTTWHANLDAPTQIVKPGITQDYVWDTTGRLTSLTETDTTTHTSPYSTNDPGGGRERHSHGAHLRAHGVAEDDRCR